MNCPRCAYGSYPDVIQTPMTDPDQGFRFLRTTCSDCGRWLRDILVPEVEAPAT